jgi:hypothetical protein
MDPPRDQETLLERARREHLKRDGGSMWDWSGDSPRDYNSENATKAAQEDAIIIECWKFKNEQMPARRDILHHEVKYIKDDEIPAWLDQPRPTRDGHPACAGLRLIHKSIVDNYERAFEPETFAAINDKFGLPPVSLHASSQATGACGRLMSGQSNGSMPPQF